MTIEIVASATFGRGKTALRIFECKETEAGAYRGYKYVNVAYLQERGIIKTTKQAKKAEEWLNTDEGKEFYKETPHTKLPI